MIAVPPALCTIMIARFVSAIVLTLMCALCHEGAILSLAENVHEDLSIEVHRRTDERTLELRGRRATLPEESSSILEDADVGTVVYTILETGPGLRYAKHVILGVLCPFLFGQC